MSGEGQLQAQRDLPIGGQAVLEGVMMRGASTWAVAVRHPTAEQIETGGLNAAEGAKGDIEVVTEPLVSYAKGHRWARLPVLRGMVALYESLKIGFKALGISANAQLPPDEQGESQEIGGAAWAGTIALALLFAIGLFFLLPAFTTNLFKDSIPSSVAFVVIEKLLRIAVFLAYLSLISRMRDLQRVFQYHGAEHKTISCYEAGLDLTPENAQRFSRLHPRCGTSFLLIVMIVAIFVFAPLGKLDWQWLLISRVVGIPLVAGLAFEVIKWFGRNRAKRWAQILMWPGLQLQRLTTREPELAQLAVAIAALEAVLQFEDPAEVTEAERVVMEVGA
ncbi:MAG TPA: DUF1385 domain-containing protein [Thermoleophilaceae bacterium]|nr:DUF1385 domain-containing protein [Thermoleophilaceae bacterium]